jgi:hypothetical protein
MSHDLDHVGGTVPIPWRYSMLLKPCLDCRHHEIRYESRAVSYCTKENCFSSHSRCISQKALRQYIKDNQVQGPLKTSESLEILYHSE